MKKINTRALVFEHFRNLGINSKKELEKKVRSAGRNNAKISNKLHLDAINEGGLLVLLGGNNAGKSNVFEGLERFSNKSLKEEDKPDFDNYKGAPELTLTYCITDEQTLQAMAIEENFTNKTYGIFFDKKTIESIVNFKKEKNGEDSITGEQYCKSLQEMLDKDEIYAVFGEYEETNRKRKEIRILLKKSNRMLACSIDEKNEYHALHCFMSVKKKFSDEKEPTIRLNCAFKVGMESETSTQKTQNNAQKGVIAGCEDTIDLRESLKKIFEHPQEIPQKNFKATLVLPKEKQQTGVAEAKKHMYAIINKIKAIENGSGYHNEELDEIEQRIEKIADIELLQPDYKKLEKIINNHNHSFHQTQEEKELVEMSKKPLESFEKTIKVDDDAIMKKHYGISFPPSITLYKEREITSKDLSVKPKENIAESAFFQTLNTILNRNKSKKEGIDIIGRIAEAETKYYRKIEKEINKHLKEVINKRFNELYCLEKEVYAFEIQLDSQEVLLNITKDKEIIDLDKQSVGFRKFFNLYFNFLYTQEIGRGDIVCIDEPENSLAIPVQRDLRDFLRKLGRQSGILFIIATHSPFMIDINHLDKVRIVKPCNEISSDLKGSAFINNISALGYGESDVLKEMFLALGGQIEFDTSKVIFVEGIADYNILTAYARIYAQNNKNTADSKGLIFLPIDGLGANKKNKKDQDSESQKDSKQSTPKMSPVQNKKVKHLLEFAKKCNILNPILLVDDDGTGRAMKEGVEADYSKFKALSVLTLKEAFIEDNKEFKKGFEHLNKENLEIEHLFSSEDEERFGFDNYKENEEVSIISSRFKDEILKKLESKENKIELSKQTKSNFDELFKYLIDFKESNNA